MLHDLERRVMALEERLSQLVRIGLVTHAFPDKGAVRVELREDDEIVTYELPILVPKTRRDKFYWMPDLREYVLCIFLPFGQEAGFVLGSFYQAVDKVHKPGQGLTRISWEDGSFVEYDKGAMKLTLSSAGIVDICADVSLIMRSPNIQYFPVGGCAEPPPAAED